ncbi:MAG: PAS domain-containing protein, partial [Chitinophagaceae bacterium]
MKIPSSPTEYINANAEADHLYASSWFQAFFKLSSQSLVVKADKDLTILAVSDNFLSLVRKQRTDLLGKPLFQVFPGSETDSSEYLNVRESFHRVINAGIADEMPVFRYEIFNPLSGKNEMFYWSNKNEPVAGTDGSVAYIINTTRNITDEIIQAQALVESESRFRRLVQESPVAVFVLKGRDMVFEAVNNMMYTLLGKGPEIIGKRYADAVPELKGQPFFKILDQVYDTGETFYGNELKGFTVRNGKLTEGYFNFIYQPVRDEAGNVSGIMCVTVDVREQVLARMDVERAEESLRFSTDSGELGTWYYESISGKFVTSPLYNEFFGFRPDEQPDYAEVIARISEQDRVRVEHAVHSSVKEGIPFKEEYKVNIPGNKSRWVRAVGKMITNESGASYL